MSTLYSLVTDTANGIEVILAIPVDIMDIGVVGLTNSTICVSARVRCAAFARSTFAAIALLGVAPVRAEGDLPGLLAGHFTAVCSCKSGAHVINDRLS